MDSVREERQRRGVVDITVALALCAAATAVDLRTGHAAEHEINTRASQWMPIVLFIEPGDTVIWRGMTGHETELIEGMGPPGAATWRSKLDDEGFKVTFEHEGAYIYKCHIHTHAGMFGAIVVGAGDPLNLAALEAAVASIESGRQFAEGVLARLKRELRRRSAR